MSSRDDEQYRELIEKLQRDEGRSAALNDIKNLIAFKPAGEALTAIRNVGLSKIVQCFNVKDNHVNLTCEVLKTCFEKFAPGDLVKDYMGHIMYLLRHEKDCVRSLAIDQVYKAIVADVSLLPVPQYIDVFVAVAQMVADKDLSVANKAILITSNLPTEAYPKILEEMKIALEYSTTSKCNAYEVAVNVASKSYEMCNLCVQHGYITHMVSELKSDDILYQLNILELLSRLAIKPHGINYLVKHGTLNSVSELLKDLRSAPLGGLLVPGYMKFFGCIAHNHPKEIFDKFPLLLDLLFEAIELNDNTVLPVALDTLAFIGTTIEGKLCLAAIGGRFIQIVERIGHLIKNGPTETKIRALYCFASLISIDKDPSKPQTGPVDHRVTLMTREWFRSLSTKPSAIDILFPLCKIPFPDINMAVLGLLDAVCQHQWGEEMVARTAGFIEYLLDRSVDNTKEAKEAKYDIIKRLSRSAAFDANTITNLQTYVEQGPFYSESTLEVAMEQE